MLKPRSSFFVRGDIWALVGGAFAILVALVLRWAVGSAYNSYEAKVLLHALIGGGFYLVSAIVAASSTILALILAAVGLTRTAETRFSNPVYGQIRWISILAAVVLAASIFTLLLMSVPLERADNIPRAWTTGVYYTISSLIAMLSGMMIALVLMLLTTVLGIIRSVTPSPTLRPDPAEAVTAERSRTVCHSDTPRPSPAR